MNQLVITGGSGGLGRAVVDAFTSPEWEISAPTHSELDVTDAMAVCEFFSKRRVDLLVCSAGITRDGLLSGISEKSWDEVIAVNYQGAACCAAATLPQMVQRRSGHIVFISSYSAVHPPTGQTAYAASKASLIGLAGALARIHGPSGIRVNAVMPGFMETAMTRPVADKRRREVLDSHHLGRFNTPAAVAGFLRFLHERLPYTSGQTFQLDSRDP